MAFRRAVLVALSAVVAACSSPAISSSPSPSAATFTLTGRVVHAPTGTPTAGATVAIVAGVNDGRTTQSNADGMFTLTNLQAGRFTIEVDFSSTGLVLTRRDVQLTQDMSLELLWTPAPPPTFTLTGRITDIGTGAALTSASLEVIDGVNTGRTATSASDGSYRFTDLTLGGFTLRVRFNGYDSEFRAVRLTGETTLDVQMRRAMQSLSGTWAGSIAYSSSGSGVPVVEATFTQSGSSLEGVLASSGGRFTGTLRNPSSIGTTTEITGTMTLFFSGGGGRNIISCQGNGSFAGTVNWARLVITAPQVTFPCAPPYTSVTVALTRQQ